MAIKFLNTVQVDTDVLYVDASVNRVGINTATPIYDLDVDGAIRASEGFIDNEDNSALRVVSPPGGSFRSASIIVGAIEVTIPNSYVKDNVTFTLEVREAGYTAYTIKIAMAGSVGIDLFPTVVSAYLTSNTDVNNNCTIKYDGIVPEFDDVKIYIETPLGNFLTNTGVFITEFTVPATVADGNLAWGLNITSVPAAATATFSNTQVTNWKRNGQDLYYGFGKVGIGTTTPSTDLEVSSTGVNGVDISQSASNASQSGRLFFTTNTASEGFALFNSNGTFQVNSGGIPNNTSGTNRISIIGSSGNVGIGTTNPITSLTLGTGSSGISFQSSSTTLNSGKIAVIKQVEVGNGNGNLAFETYQGGGGGGERMRILNDGNVGIGTTSPDTKQKYHLYAGGVRRLTSTDTTVAGESIGRVEFKSNDASTGGNNVMGFVDCLATNAGSTYALTFGTGSAAAATEKMRINQSGNVGIGTTSPSELLHLSSTGPARLLIEADTDNITETDNAQIILKQDGGAVVGNLGYKTNTNSLEITNNYAAADGILTLGTSGIERMRIDYLGNVGIGTTSLTAISSSVATLSLGSTSASTSGGIAFQANGVVKAYNYVASNYLYSQTVGGIGQIFYIAGSERMRIHNTTGNVGINTTDPKTKLHVVSASGSDVPTAGTATGGLFVSNTNKTYGTNMGVSGSGWSFIQSQRADGLSNLYSLNLQPLGGSVGIGTTSPRSKLQVEGVTGSVPALGAAASAAQIGGSTYGTLFSTLTSGTGVIQQGRSDGVTLTFPLLINPNGGNVGIGVTSPSYQLQLSTNSAAKPSSSAWTVTSDSRVKENVRDYKTGLEAILSIEPKLYDYNGKAGFEKTKDNIGVIAQEIQEVMPETINTYKAKLNEGDEEETELLNFDSHAVTFALINAVKDLKAEIDELKKQINN